MASVTGRGPSEGVGAVGDGVGLGPVVGKRRHPTSGDAVQAVVGVGDQADRGLAAEGIEGVGLHLALAVHLLDQVAGGIEADGGAAAEGVDRDGSAAEGIVGRGDVGGGGERRELDLGHPAGLVVFLLAAATDWLDGYVARKMGLAGPFGRNFDPLVDKVLICGAFIFLLPVPEDYPPTLAVSCR